MRLSARVDILINMDITYSRTSAMHPSYLHAIIAAFHIPHHAVHYCVQSKLPFHHLCHH